MFAFRKQVHGILAILTPISASLHIHGSRWTIPARTEALLMNCLCGTREVQVPVKRKSHPHTGFPWLSATNLSPRALINPDVDREEFHLFSLSALSCRSLADGQWDLWRWQEASRIFVLVVVDTGFVTAVFLICSVYKVIQIETPSVLLLFPLCLADVLNFMRLKASRKPSAGSL